MNIEKSYATGLEALKRVQQFFPELKMNIDEDDPNVDINMDIFSQDGLDFDINLNLQNINELHLGVGKLWMCWFPCTEKENVDDFIDTVSGLIYGKYRILETLRGGRVVKARFQKSINGQRVSKSSGLLNFKLPSFRRRTFNILQNNKNA